MEIHANAGAHARRRSVNGSATPVRRRISRACDQCNQLRTKCDGKFPCAHCVESGITCEYARERKKRGKVSKKDIAAQQAVAAAGESMGGTTMVHATDTDDSPVSGREYDAPLTASGEISSEMHGLKRKRSPRAFMAPQLPLSRPEDGVRQQSAHGMYGAVTGQMDTGNGVYQANGHGGSNGHALPTEPIPSMTLPTPHVSSGGSLALSRSDYASMDDYHRSVLHPANSAMTGHNILNSGTSPIPNSILQGGTITGYGDSPYGMASPNVQGGITSAAPFRLGESPVAGGDFLGQSPPIAGSPGGWLSLPSPSASIYAGLAPTTSTQTGRYPVLRPLIPHISSIIPIGLACDLLELYFASTATAFLQPLSPYVVGYVVRKHSFLRQTNPRPCSPALLASMLWISAQTSESAFLTSPPSARGRICQKLLELTVSLLRPLIHTSGDQMPNYGASTVIDGVALGGFGVALPSQAHDTSDGSSGAAVAVDDVATYLHLATVVSASEYKAASLRWWNSAWTLAREMKLGRELPPQNEAVDPSGLGDLSGKPIIPVSEELREERRRIWWLLYIVDRHLALCYNRPLFLLDVECESLFQPLDDVLWQAGEFFQPENLSEIQHFRPQGPPFQCTGHSIFGFFLPLMTILGEIVDLNHARKHPRFGAHFRISDEREIYAQEISHHLDSYARSLKDFQNRHSPLQQDQPSAPELNGDHTSTSTTNINQNNISNPTHQDQTSPSAHSAGTNTSATATAKKRETALQTQTVIAYGTHLLHTLHVLINGRWDPLTLLDDNDLWISTPSFMQATSHAVEAADAINSILDLDPDLSFMPFFFGIYLLQGSFLLLLIADKLQADATPNVIRACEAIVRAHEACVVTLNTEYQRNFRKVMRSALAQVRGRVAEDFGEQRLRRREVLALYRWTGDGTGLAL